MHNASSIRINIKSLFPTCLGASEPSPRESIAGFKNQLPKIAVIYKVILNWHQQRSCYRQTNFLNNSLSLTIEL